MFNKSRKRSRIFRWVWRVNSVLILLMGLGTFCFLAVGTLSIVSEQFRRREYNSVRVQTEPNQTLKIKFNYGKFAKVEGTNIAISPITSEQKTYSSVFDSSSSSIKTGYSTAVRNFAFLNLPDQTTRFLLPNNDKLITASSKITEKKNSSDDSQSIIAHISYQVVGEDTNGDGQLNLKDKLSIAFSSVDGTNYVEILKDIDEITGEERIGDDSMLYTFVTNGKTRISLINLPERRIVSTRELPLIE